MKDTPVEYDDSQHLYSHGKQKYTSASQLVEKFYEKFDTQLRAERYAEKHGQTPEYWIKKWTEKRVRSEIRGNHIHDSNEVALQGRMIDRFKGKTLPVHSERIRDEDPWILRPDGVYTERKLWHHGYRIAGRADKILLESVENYTSTHLPIPHTARFAHVQDYKTNENIKKESYQFSNGSFKMMYPPLAHLMDCNWIHYCLQLSIYMFMLEYQGFQPGTITLIHYPHPTEDDPSPKPIPMDVPYMKKEVLSMCNYLNR